MNQALSLMVCEFETQEQEDGYILWLRQKYAANLADKCANKGPNVSHDGVMTKARALLHQKKTAHGMTKFGFRCYFWNDGRGMRPDTVMLCGCCAVPSLALTERAGSA